MKKTASKAVAVVFVLSLFVCLIAACGTKDNFSGTKWKMDSMETSGVSVSADLLDSFGFKGTLEFGKDGKVSLSVEAAGENESKEGTFAIKDENTVTITIDNESQDATVTDGKLTFKDSDATIVFIKDEG